MTVPSSPAPAAHSGPHGGPHGAPDVDRYDPAAVEQKWQQRWQ